MNFSKNVLPLSAMFFFFLSTFVSAGKLCCTTENNKQTHVISQSTMKNCLTAEKVERHDNKHSIKGEFHENKLNIHSEYNGNMCFSLCVCCQTAAVSMLHKILHVFCEEENEIEISPYDNLFSQTIYHPPSFIV